MARNQTAVAPAIGKLKSSSTPWCLKAYQAPNAISPATVAPTTSEMRAPAYIVLRLTIRQATASARNSALRVQSWRSRNWPLMICSIA